jgi:hypothetical protein
MKRCLLLILFATITTITQAQLEEDFSPNPTGWIRSQGAKFSTFNGNDVVETPGVGGNNPVNIGTPVVNKTSNTVRFGFIIGQLMPMEIPEQNRFQHQLMQISCL